MIILGLGSNVENRLEYLQNAITLLNKSALEITLLSPIYESDALLKPGAPKEWDIKFLNMVVAGETKLTPHELLFEIKSIEDKIGRQDRGIWAPREIDIDILRYDDLIILEENFQIPHKSMFDRGFVLLPLADILPNLVIEEKGTTVHSIAENFSVDNSLCKTDYILNLQK